MKIAVCISGQMRTFEEAAISLKKEIFDKYDCDIFIHTWNERGITTDVNRLFPKGMNSYFLEDVVNDSKLFMQKYNLLFNDILDENTINKEKLLETYSNVKGVVIEETPKDYEKTKSLYNVQYPKYLQELYPRRYHNLAMFYKIYQCNELKKAYEIENNFEYDIVIRIRPDVSLTSEFTIPKDVQEDTIYVKAEMKDEKYIHDQLFLSESKTMDKISSLWLELNKYWDENFDKEWSLTKRTIGNLLYYHCIDRLSLRKREIKYSSSLGTFQDKKTPTFDFFSQRIKSYLLENSLDVKMFLAINRGIAENALLFYETNKGKTLELLKKYYIFGYYSFSHPLYGLGYYYFLEKEYQKSEFYFEKAYELEPNDYKIFKLYVEVAFLNKNYLKVEKILSTAEGKSFYKIAIDFLITYYRKISKEIIVKELYFNNDLEFFVDKSLYKIGLVFFQNNEFKEAIKIFEYIIQKSDFKLSVKIDSYYKLAQAYYKVDDIKQARIMIENALSHRKDKTSYIILKVNLLIKEVNYDDAYQYLLENETYLLDKEKNSYYYYRIKTSLLVNKEIEALALFSKIEQDYKDISSIMNPIVEKYVKG
jgi:hypothetical protein